MVQPGYAEKVMLLSYKEDELPFMRATPSESPFFYFYRGLLETLGILFPFSDFQCTLLRRLNVALSQLHTNSWVIVTFEVLCPLFNI